jgi:hypothetical protein
MNDSSGSLPTIGWREFVSLPELRVKAIKVKVDTGARSSSLHAFDVETFLKDGREHVRFKIHPMQRNDLRVIDAEVPIFDFRSVRSSSGKASVRPVILTTVELLGQAWPIELTLANRDEMGFRMLLGREAFRGRMLVDAGNSYFGGIPRRKKRRKKEKAGLTIVDAVTTRVTGDC